MMTLLHLITALYTPVHVSGARRQRPLYRKQQRDVRPNDRCWGGSRSRGTAGDKHHNPYIYKWYTNEESTD